MKSPYELMTFLLCLELFKVGNIFLSRKTENLSKYYFLVKSRHCEKATQFEKYPPVLESHWVNNKTYESVFSISCGLLRKSELEMGGY